MCELREINEEPAAARGASEPSQARSDAANLKQPCRAKRSQRLVRAARRGNLRGPAERSSMMEHPCGRQLAADDDDREKCPKERPASLGYGGQRSRGLPTVAHGFVGKRERRLVEAPGVAPGSENTSPQESTMRIRF
jgi:hypothetical protein